MASVNPRIKEVIKEAKRNDSILAKEFFNDLIPVREKKVITRINYQSLGSEALLFIMGGVAFGVMLGKIF